MDLNNIYTSNKPISNENPLFEFEAPYQWFVAGTETGENGELYALVSHFKDGEYNDIIFSVAYEIPENTTDVEALILNFPIYDNSVLVYDDPNTETDESGGLWSKVTSFFKNIFK